MGARTHTDRWGPLHEDTDTAVFCTEEGVFELAETVPDGSLPVEDAAALPLVFTHPCFVQMSNRVFCAREEGFYRFSRYPQTVHNRILFRHDLPRLVGAISQLHVHGWRHNRLPLDQLRKMALDSRLSLACGYITDLTVSLLEDLGFRARPVSVFTLETWNSYSCGHRMLEFFDPEEMRWLLADADLGVMYHAGDRRLDAVEVCTRIRNRQAVEMVNVTAGASADLSTDPADRQRAFFEQSMSFFLLPGPRERFMRRCYQVPNIDEDYTVDTVEERERFEALCKTVNLSYSYLPREAFLAKHYS